MNIAMFIFLGIAACLDLRYRKIPNRLIMAGLAVGFLLSSMGSGVIGVLSSASAFLLGFMLLLPGYLFRYTGGGDLKLFATLGVYSGPSLLLEIYVISILIGACFVLGIAVKKYFQKGIDSFCGRYRNRLSTFYSTGRFAYIPLEERSIRGMRIPMVPIFALGFILNAVSKYIGT